MATSTRTAKRILAMDGGPSGFTYLRCLRKIEEHVPGFLSRVQVLAGTSFGSACALYFAKHLADIRPGDSALDVIDGCIELTDALYDFQPSAQNYQYLVGGKRSMYSDYESEALLSRSENLGSRTTLRDLSREVVLVSARVRAPWRPEIYSNGPEAPFRDKSAVEVALESSAFPVIMPVRNGHVDGGFVANNPSMTAVAQTMARHRSSGLRTEDLALLSLGGDGGTSKFSDMSVPGQENDEAASLLSVPLLPSLPKLVHDRLPESLQRDGAAKRAPGLAELLDKLPPKLRQEIDERIGDIQTLHQEFLENIADPDFTLSRLGMRFFDADEDLFEAPPATDTGLAQPWGWRPWLVYLRNPVFALQILLNSHGLGAFEQCRMLLDDRCLRLAPMAFLDTNQVLITLLLFGCRFGLGTLIHSSAQLTADLWSWRWTNDVFDVRPRFADTMEWVETYWME